MARWTAPGLGRLGVLSRAGLGLAGLAAALLLGELLVGWVAPQIYRRPPVWRFDPQLGWSHIPSSSGWLISPEFRAEYRIDAEGLRDREVMPARAAGVWRALALGDSYVEGWGVRVEDSVSKRLEAELRRSDPGRSFEVLNGGVAGYGTDQELLLFEQLGPRFAPDWVILFFYGNDLWNNAARKGIGTERGDKPFFVMGPDGELRLAGVPVRRSPYWDEAAGDPRPWGQRLDRHLSRHWHLYALLRRSLAPEVPERQQREYYEGLYGTTGDVRWRRAWDLTGRLLRRLADRVRAGGGRMLLVYVPATVQVEEKDWQSKRQLHGLVGAYDLDGPNRRLAELAGACQLPYLDLSDPFRQAAADEVLYFRDSHWNPRGHDLAARQVAACLRRVGALDE